jgi:hypothetical protein
MLYKVTPALAPPARRHSSEEAPRRKKRRASAVFDADGHEVLITLMCLKCRQVRPLAQFGLRKMPDGAIRNQPWCRSCRGAATPKRRPVESEAPGPLEASAPLAAIVAGPAPAEPASVAAASVEPAVNELAPLPRLNG